MEERSANHTVDILGILAEVVGMAPRAPVGSQGRVLDRGVLLAAGYMVDTGQWAPGQDKVEDFRSSCRMRSVS